MSENTTILISPAVALETSKVVSSKPVTAGPYLSYDQRYRLSNKAKVALKNKRYREQNRDKIKARMKQWCELNRAKINARVKNRNKANPILVKLRNLKNRPQRLAYTKRYAKANRIIIAAKRKLRRQLNPEVETAYSHKRRAIKRNSRIGNQKLIIAWNKRWRKRRFAICYWCKDKFETHLCESDHIIPLARGGAHSIENLCISCASCNRKKRARLLDIWNQQLEQPVLLL